MKRKLWIPALIVVVAVAGLTWWLMQHRGADRRAGALRQHRSSAGSTRVQQQRAHRRRTRSGGRPRQAGPGAGALGYQPPRTAGGPGEAQAAAQQQVVTRLRNGSRPEEIAQARANVESAKADVVNAQRQYERLKNAAEISAGRAVRQQDVDTAKAALQVAEAKLAVNQKALDLSVLGPRKEDIAENEARLRANEAQAALLRQQLADSQLIAPTNAVVRTRIMEPGEMASPQRPVFSLAITDPKWVRAYVSEPDLGKIHPGMAAAVGGR